MLHARGYIGVVNKTGMVLAITNLTIYLGKQKKIYKNCDRYEGNGTVLKTGKASVCTKERLN